jgi:hypothetical protein
MGGYILLKLWVIKLELAVGCNYIRSSGTIISLTLREEGSSIVTRDCDTGNCLSRSTPECVCDGSGTGDGKSLKPLRWQRGGVQAPPPTPRAAAGAATWV